jgi:two-component system response regulator QseB
MDYLIPKPKIAVKRILVINTDKLATCVKTLRNETNWRIVTSSLELASKYAEKSYYDLTCLEANKDNQKIYDFLKKLKNNKLGTKVLAIIPNDPDIKRELLSYGCDDYIPKPYNCEDLILRCKKLLNCLPRKYQRYYESNFLKYNRRFDVVTYKGTYLPLTPRETLILKILIKEGFANKNEIRKYLKAKLGKQYSDGYITVMIHRIRKKIKLCTGRDLIRNKYGSGYYVL